MQLHIVGAQNTGKTFLISKILELSRNGEIDYPLYVQELSYRKRARSGELAVNKSGTVESQREILDSIIEDIVPNSNRITVVDRCPLDNLGYTRALQWKSLNDGSGNSGPFCDFIEESVEKITKFYSELSKSDRVMVLYLPICGCTDVPLVERANREISDLEYRRTIDDMLFDSIHLSTFYEYYDVHTLVGTVHQKLQSIDRIISNAAS